ncbi:hypothetical protein [Umezawaea beigongshangensis]|uniref:hypothetical protein n=1 Tax=Umezawaea beigongshangensis TaxID=2780383 RepID=UPI0018F23BEB|nr:hypothetical protein [Umezawaea beigongshangensis]
MDVFYVLLTVAQQYRAERLSPHDGEYHFASPELRLLDALAIYAGFPEHRLPAGPVLSPAVVDRQPIPPVFAVSESGTRVPDTDKSPLKTAMSELVANQTYQEEAEVDGEDE